MSRSKFCEDCNFWEQVYEKGSAKFGICDHPLVDGKVIIEREQPIDADETIFTHQYFGCIYHEPKGGRVVTKID